MIKFLPGLLLLQAVTLVLLWVNLDQHPALDSRLVLAVGVPILFLVLVTAFWFDSIGKHRATSTIAKMESKHAREREKIRVRSEQEKLKVMEKAQQEIHRQSRVVSSKANLKVGAAFVAATGAGVVMLMANLVTFGLVTMMTAGGAMGGYLLRYRHEQTARTRLLENETAQQLEGGKQPKLINKVIDQSSKKS